MATPEQDLARATIRSALERHGFVDDGEAMSGMVDWVGPAGRSQSTPIVVRLDDRFPFAPPRVQLDEKHGALDTITPTFHMEPTGDLCLYEPQVSEAEGGWSDPQRFLQRTAGWLEQTALGWPDDTDTDLERYLEPVGRLLVYDNEDVVGRVGLVRVSRQANLLRVRWERPFPQQGNSNNGVRRRIERAENLGVVVDAGELTAPIRTWPELLVAIGGTARRIEMLHRLNGLRLMIVHYKRNGHPGLLALECRPMAGAPGGVSLRAYESADESVKSRTLRSGRKAVQLAKQKVAIIGCGGIGSFAADSLFRSGIGLLTLLDRQLLRPGNVIRHLAGESEVGKLKVEAVLACLAKIGLPVDGVTVKRCSVTTLDEAIDLLEAHMVVVDATGDDRTTVLLQAAVEQSGGSLVSVCLQREGGIARVDRWPLRGGETHFDAVPELPGPAPLVRERGCGDVVSLTPPYSVQAAAALVSTVVVGILTGADVPPSALEVLQAQPDVPYDHAGPLAA